MHEEHTHNLNDDWKKAREDQRLQSQSIANIYEKKSSVYRTGGASDLDSSQLIVQSQRLDQEFQNLETQQIILKRWTRKKYAPCQRLQGDRQVNGVKRWRHKNFNRSQVQNTPASV